MIIQTDVKCLYCGHVSWRVEMEHGAQWRTAEMVWPELGGTLPAHPHCTRCGGPVYLDGDYREVRMRQSEARMIRPPLATARAVRMAAVGAMTVLFATISRISACDRQLSGDSSRCGAVRSVSPSAADAAVDVPRTASKIMTPRIAEKCRQTAE